jgi:23S rRNA (pseudouridine1915-N3)-methyltransferase
LIRILAVGRLRSAYVREGVNDYLRRIGRLGRLRLEEVADSEPTQEGRQLLARAKGDPLVACDRRGEFWSSDRIAELLGSKGSPCFILGGPEGLSAEVLEKADSRLSFGALTLPHELARLVLVEQIYRGLTIVRGHPYHR